MFGRSGRDEAETTDARSGPLVVVVEADGLLTYRLRESCPEFSVEQAQHVDDAIKGALGATIVVLGPEASSAATLDRVEELQELSPAAGLTVILAVTKISTALLRRALRAGISDVVTLGARGEIEDAVRRIAARSALRTPSGTGPMVRGRVVAVFSPKGGVGTTSVAINLAAQRDSSGLPNAIVDADLPFGDVAINLGVEPSSSLADATGSDLDLARLTALFATPKSVDMRALVAPSDPARAELIAANDVSRTLELCREVAPLVVVDTASAFDDITLAVLSEADAIVIVVSPDLAAVKNVKIAMQTMRQLGIGDSRMLVLLNRVPARPALRAADIEKALGVETMTIPEDPAVSRAAFHGAAAVTEAPKSPAAKAFARFSERLLLATTSPISA